MAVQSISMTAAGNSPSVKLPMKGYLFGGQTGIACLLNFSSGASASATVQISNDPNASPDNSVTVQNSARWQNHDILQGITANKNSSIVFPIYAVRLVLTNYVGGTVTLDLGIPDYTS